ncbi:MAG: energy transducer TonB [Bacteroidetes bacterium]|nr:energy transducer TonB [Bacteroidota bacterium]
MKRHDLYGLGASLGIHLLLLLVMSLVTVAATDRIPIGYIEVEFGPFSQGRPSVRAPETPTQVVHDPVEAEPDVLDRTAVSPPDEVRPVDLPDQVAEVVDEEVIEESEAETIAPEDMQSREEIEDPIPEPEKETIQPLGSGSLDASDGVRAGDDGTSNEEERSAPFRIEGLNRQPVSTPLPVYTEQVNAFISIRITVDPQGRIIRRVPLMKGNPKLEKAVMDALLRWRFNPLPPNAPRENQTGTIAFRFTLR